MAITLCDACPSGKCNRKGDSMNRIARRAIHAAAGVKLASVCVSAQTTPHGKTKSSAAGSAKSSAESNPNSSLDACRHFCHYHLQPQPATRDPTFSLSGGFSLLWSSVAGGGKHPGRLRQPTDGHSALRQQVRGRKAHCQRRRPRNDSRARGLHGEPSFRERAAG